VPRYGTILAQNERRGVSSGLPAVLVNRCGITMPGAGLEPARDHSQRFLRPPRLPLPPPRQNLHTPLLLSQPLLVDNVGAGHLGSWNVPGDHLPHPPALPYPAANGGLETNNNSFRREALHHGKWQGESTSGPAHDDRAVPPTITVRAYPRTLTRREVWKEDPIPSRPHMEKWCPSGAGSGPDHHFLRSPGAGHRVAATPAWSEGQRVTDPSHGCSTVMRSLGSAPMTSTMLRPPNPALPYRANTRSKRWSRRDASLVRSASWQQV
jgi:hypothetical protein